VRQGFNNLDTHFSGIASLAKAEWTDFSEIDVSTWNRQTFQEWLSWLTRNIIKELDAITCSEYLMQTNSKYSSQV